MKYIYLTLFSLAFFISNSAFSQNIEQNEAMINQEKVSSNASTTVQKKEAQIFLNQRTRFEQKKPNLYL